MSKITVADIMTTHLVTIASDATLDDAHEITRSKGIRHLPVMDRETGNLCGLLTQKKMISKVISLVALYGQKALERKERYVSVMEVAETDFVSVHPAMSVAEVVSFFLENRHGCLPVLDGDDLVGIVTSSDFVRLCGQLLTD